MVLFGAVGTPGGNLQTSSVPSCSACKLHKIDSALRSYGYTYSTTVTSTTTVRSTVRYRYRPKPAKMKK